MRLTLSLLKQIAPGNIFTGRNRIYPKVTARDLRKAKEDIARTEKNMLLLRHPYLSLKESYGHEESLHDPKDLELQKKLKDIDIWKQRRNRTDVTMEERFLVLQKSDKWD